MKFLIFPRQFWILMILALFARGHGFDHESLTTTEGRVFHEIFVLGADPSGLTFRHREGIAKVPFTSLSSSYRMLYETFEDLPPAEAGAAGETRGEDPVPTGDEAVGEPADAPIASPDEGPVFFVSRNRVVLALPSRALLPGGGVDFTRRLPPWPSWWPNHEGTHRLTHPLYRELVLRDFLHHSGLLPLPCGW